VPCHSSVGPYWPAVLSFLQAASSAWCLLVGDEVQTTQYSQVPEGIKHVLVALQFLCLSKQPMLASFCDCETSILLCVVVNHYLGSAI
jgi:hypothetical protein